MGKLLRPGGPNDVRPLGGDTYEMRIPLPDDGSGMMARECLDEDCVPGYFKIRPGTGVVEEGYDKCFCPYCGTGGDQNDFVTSEQVEYAKSVMVREASDGAERMLREGLGLDRTGRRQLAKGLIDISMEMKSSGKPSLRYPSDEELRRDVVCSHCTLEHEVYGLATWCPDCGEDIFLEHIGAEFEVVEKVLGDVDDRRKRLGPRVALRDVENALEDVVSIFEGVLKFVLRRRLERSQDSEDVEAALRRLRGGFQSPIRAEEILREQLGVELFGGGDGTEKANLARAFEKRHPITHNLGVADLKYLERSDSQERPGREVALTVSDVSEAASTCRQVLERVYLASKVANEET